MGILTKPQTYNPAENDVEEHSPKSTQSRNIKKNSKEVYHSDVVGEYIKDAITGAIHPSRVGTTDEAKFFRVVITTHGRSVHKAFYDSPSAYMKHNHCQLDEEYVKEWYNSKNEQYPGLFEQ